MSAAHESPPVADEVEEIGTGSMVNNQQLAEWLYKAVRSGGQAAESVPKLIEMLTATDKWRFRKATHYRQEFRMAADEFTRFLTAKMPEGIESTPAEVERYLAGSGPILARFLELVRRSPGNPNVGTDTPRADGRFSVVRADDEEHRITHNMSNTVDEPTQPAPSPRKTQTGTSLGYTVSRLAREAAEYPEGPAADAYARLMRGEITANAAAVLAGHRPKLITIPPNPSRAGRLLARHFDPDQFEALARAYRAAIDSHAREDDR